MAALISRVFMNGNSQAVRIPQELRLDATRVEISRGSAGELVIRPLPNDRGQALMEALQGFDDAYVRQLEEDRAAASLAQEREPL